jgi:peptide methionine sulfoxide reductase MsrA
MRSLVLALLTLLGCAREDRAKPPATPAKPAVLYLNDAQRETAEDVKERVTASGTWKAPIVTEIVAATEFTVGEAYHQDFLQRDPDGYTCHYVRD